MGAWSEDNFGNDDAGDWVWELEKSKGTDTLMAPLNYILSNEGYLESPCCAEALAAAEVVASGVSGDLDAIPEGAKKWLSQKQGLFGKKPKIEKEHAVVAKLAVEKIVASSELKDLWEETDDYTSWCEIQRTLLSKLANA